jgi:hypothetical protein
MEHEHEHNSVFRQRNDVFFAENLLTISAASASITTAKMAEQNIKVLANMLD